MSNTYGLERITLSKVKDRQPEWFSRKNKRFFGDVSYRVLYGKRTGNPYLVRSTYAWTDMFGEQRKLHYRINRLESDLEIGDLIDEVFDSIYAVKAWMKTEELDEEIVIGWKTPEEIKAEQITTEEKNGNKS